MIATPERIPNVTTAANNRADVLHDIWGRAFNREGRKGGAKVAKKILKRIGRGGQLMEPSQPTLTQPTGETYFEALRLL